MATLQFKDDCDSMKVGLREFDSSWTWQANELRATALFSTRTSSLSSVGRAVSCDADVRRFQHGSLPPEFGKYGCQCLVLVREEALRSPPWRVRQIGVLRSGETFGDAGVAITLPAAKIDILVGQSGGDALGLSRRATFHIVSGEKALSSRMQRFSEGAMLECTAHTFFRRFETKRQYPDEKADSRVGIKMQKIESLQSRVEEGPRRGRRDYFKVGHLGKALKVLWDMPIEADVLAWKAILSAYGQIDVARIRAIMRDRGIKRFQAAVLSLYCCTWLEGYEPDMTQVLVDVVEEEKESILKSPQ
ncbi:hypothetical protein GIB67_025862 [Kingdonia uniflora]|uniref:Pentatricopeptide repeat-containing protein n=1 Tax=Kingdonia uniflora TaxID=39325 RepID=A0A7J7MDK1_9MAGN|nr:hypothetical protein GIB67_025862 [Kingdonia uniflora]